jgi:uracil-DNA glycosylase family 4
VPTIQSPDLRRALVERIRYYNELGIYDFYRRDRNEASESATTEVELQATSSSQPELREEMSPRKSAVVVQPADHNSFEVLPPKPEQSVTDPIAALKLIREDLGDCTRCKLHQQGRKQIVFGVGNPQADLMFVGEGPGADEDAQGEPFVGRAGQLLNNMIQAMGLSREDVYIANVVKCRPPDNRTPERDECDTCGPFLMRQIAVVRPEIIVALGATAAKYLLGVSDSMANLRGHLYDFQPFLPKGAPERDPAYSTKLVVTYHPAYLLRDPRQKKEAWLDLQKVMKYLGMAVPQRAEPQNNPEA